MHPQHTIPIIKKELIRGFASLDRSFDDRREFLHFTTGNWSAMQILQHVSIANDDLLVVIRDAAFKAIELAKEAERLDEWFDEYNLVSFETEDFLNYKSTAWIKSNQLPTDLSLHQIRSTLRAQLGECFDYIDLLKNGEGVLYKSRGFIPRAGELDVYHLVFFLANYVKNHAGEIERLQTEYGNPMELQ
jgi:hypothetical protein